MYIHIGILFSFLFSLSIFFIITFLFFIEKYILWINSITFYVVSSIYTINTSVKNAWIFPFLFLINIHEGFAKKIKTFFFAHFFVFHILFMITFSKLYIISTYYSNEQKWYHEFNNNIQIEICNNLIKSVLFSPNMNQVFYFNKHNY